MSINSIAKILLFIFISVLMVSSVNGQNKRTLQVKPKYPKEPINVEVESSDDDTVIAWMTKDVIKHKKTIERRCTKKCKFCNKREFFEKKVAKNGKVTWIKISGDIKSKRVYKSKTKVVLEEHNGKLNRKGPNCCPKKQSNGVSHENIWESKM